MRKYKVTYRTKGELGYSSFYVEGYTIYDIINEVAQFEQNFVKQNSKLIEIIDILKIKDL